MHNLFIKLSCWFLKETCFVLILAKLSYYKLIQFWDPPCTFSSTIRSSVLYSLWMELQYVASLMLHNAKQVGLGLMAMTLSVHPGLTLSNIFSLILF